MNSDSQSEKSTHKFKFESSFQNGDAELTVEFTASDYDRDAAKQQARNLLEQHVGNPDEWSRTVLRVAFDNPPWDSIDDILDRIRGHDAVSSAYFERALDGAYSPPKIHARTQDNDTGRVIDDLSSYYSGLCFEEQGKEVIVYVTPVSEDVSK